MRLMFREKLLAACSAVAVALPSAAPAQDLTLPPAVVQAGANADVQAGNFNLYNQVPWFANAAIRQRLQINENQFGQLNRAYQKSWNAYNLGLRALDRRLTPAERQLKEAELYYGFRSSFYPEVESTLADKLSRQRYNQLYTQYRGYSVFNDPAIQAELHLTQTQTNELQKLNRDWSQQLYLWSRDYSKNREGVTAEFAAARKQVQARINAVLTPDQQHSWLEYYGEPHDFDADVYFQNDTAISPSLK